MNPEKKQDGWQPIESAPKDGRCVFLFYRNSLGRSRIVKASWIASDEIETWEDPDGCEPGFYERSEAHEAATEIIYPVDGTPTHWMPLPEPPKARES